MLAGIKNACIVKRSSGTSKMIGNVGLVKNKCKGNSYISGLDPTIESKDKEEKPYDDM